MLAFQVQPTVEPNTDQCRALPIGPEFSRCLVEDSQCKHTIFVRDKFYCHHPEHRSFEIETVSPLKPA
ncbi:hypothetical protein AOG1_05490 [Geobacter sp. AOG1]|nr:hypothetical protein AOG1_05490 [Geobacter sp. AOG1]